MRALVSGATGFVGSHLAARLVGDGHEVHVLVRPTSDQTAISALRPRVGIHVLSASGDNLEELVQSAAPEVIFHIAAHVVAEHRAADIGPLVSSNILFPCQLADAMVRKNVYKLVNCSTIWQHYNDHAYSPTSLYAATKEAFLALLKFYTETTPLQVVDLALSDTYGPHDRRGRLLSVLFEAAAGRNSVPFSPGGQLIDLVYVDDVIDAFVQAAERLPSMPAGTCERYAVRSGQPLQLRDLVATFAEVTGLSPKVAWGARPYRGREMMVPWACGTVLPGWIPKIGLKEGIRRLNEAQGASRATL